jgi:hypothetical protein
VTSRQFADCHLACSQAAGHSKKPGCVLAERPARDGRFEVFRAPDGENSIRVLDDDAFVDKLVATVDELRAALHLAYDWMGRPARDQWDDAHLNEAVRRVEEALRR